METHKDEKLFPCNLCHNFFSLKGNLKTHIQTLTGEKPFTCNQCYLSLFPKNHLKTHTGEKSFTCNQFPKAFSKGDNLKTHFRTHTGKHHFLATIVISHFHKPVI